jgi:sugar O-acyltransferase (sialic acid O-acetyltransferase NeuD family)
MMALRDRQGRNDSGERLPVVGIGAGGHSRVVMSVLRMHKLYVPVCLLDRDEKLWGQKVDGVTIDGGDDLLASIRDRGVADAFNGVGSVGDTGARRRVFDMLAGAGMRCIAVVHASAVIADDVDACEGVQIMACAVISCATVIGRNVLIGSGAVIEHECRIHDHAVISPRAAVCGGCTVGVGSFIGAGAVLKQGVRIGSGCVVGAGAVVLRDVSDRMRVAGVPARDIGSKQIKREGL